MMTQRTIDDWLSLAYRESDECPPPELFLRAEWEALTSDERRVAELHAANCPACAAERDLAQTFDLPSEWSEQAESGLSEVLAQIGNESGSAADAHSAHEEGGKVSRFPWLPALFSPPTLGLAAAAAVALLAVGLVVQTRSLAPPELPDAPIKDVTRGGRVEVIAPKGELGDVPDELSWRAVEGATTYEVTLTAVDETVLWRGVSVTGRIVLPDETRSALQAAVVYFWQVEAFDGAGLRVAWSGRTSFLVTKVAAEESR